MGPKLLLTTLAFVLIAVNLFFYRSIKHVDIEILESGHTRLRWPLKRKKHKGKRRRGKTRKVKIYRKIDDLSPELARKVLSRLEDVFSERERELKEIFNLDDVAGHRDINETVKDEEKKIAKRGNVKKEKSEIDNFVKGLSKEMQKEALDSFKE